MGYYYPSTEAESIVWNQNFIIEILARGPALRIPEEEINAQTAEQQAYLDSVINERTMYDAWQKSCAIKNELKKNTGKNTRKFVQDYLQDCPDDVKKIFRVVSTPESPLPTDHKPVITAEVTGGRVKITCVMKGMEGLNLYRSRNGEPAVPLVPTAIKSPYYDNDPLGESGTTGTVEYYGIPVINNMEVGQASEIVTVRIKG